MHVRIQSKEGGKEIVDLNRRKAIHEKCLNCSAWIPSEVRTCAFKECSLWPYRSCKGKQDPDKRQKAIRAYCRWCMCDQPQEIRLCPSTDCPLWSYRMGKVNRSIEIQPTILKSPRIEDKTKDEFEIEYSG